MGTKYSNAQTECTADLTAELYSKFLIEKDAKNEAYHFILAHGLLDLFNEFHRTHGGVDHYAECMRIVAARK